MCEGNTQNTDTYEIGFSRSNLFKISMTQTFMFYTAISTWSQHATDSFGNYLLFRFFLSIKKRFIFEFVLVSELSIALRVRLMYSTFFACNLSKT